MTALWDMIGDGSEEITKLERHFESKHYFHSIEIAAMIAKNVQSDQLRGLADFRKAEKECLKQITRINMYEYYILTRIEVSCTSVDIDDKILRFFNHKTTPLLPICRAVQMTGSFPVAFEAQTWKREWGDYYVYKSSVMTVIDITGHQFTDGGMLANFPIRYLDNMDISKNYFSHQP